VQLGNQAGVGFIGVAGPNPYEAVALFNRVGAIARKAANPLTRHTVAFAAAVHFKAVVAANQFAISHKTQGQRSATVRAKIFHGGDATFIATEEN
jgi:hypothetical protein